MISRFLGVDDAFYSTEFSTISYRSIDKGQRNKMGELLEISPIMEIIVQLPASIKLKIKRRIFFAFSRRKVRPVLDETVRKELVGHLREDMDRLRAFTGHKFENWCL